MNKMQCKMAKYCDEVRCPSKKLHDKTDVCAQTCSVNPRSTCMPVYQENDIKVVIADILTTALEKLNEVGVYPVTVDAGEWEERYHALRAETTIKIESLKEQVKRLQEENAC